MTEQAHGSYGRLIVCEESAFRAKNALVVEGCQDVWNETVDPDFTVTLDTVDPYYKTNSVKFAIADLMTAGDKATEAITPALDFSSYVKIGLAYKSSIVLASGDMQLLLDEHASCVSPLETLDIPAVSAGQINTWRFSKIALAAPATDLAIISIGLKGTVDKGAMNFWIGGVWGLKKDGVVVPIISCNLSSKQGRNQSKILAADRNPRKSTLGAIECAGNAPSELNPFMCEMFKNLFGTVVTTDLTGGKYSHEFTIGHPGSLNMEAQLTDTDIYRLFSGGVVNGFDLGVGPEGVISISFDLLAGEEFDDEICSTLDGNPTDHGHDPFDAFEIDTGDLLEGGAAIDDVADFKISFKNNRSGKATIGSQGKKSSLPAGIVDISGSLEILLKSTTMPIYRKAKANTESSLKLTVIKGTGVGTAGNEKVEFDMQEVFYDVPEINIQDAPISISPNFRAEYINGANASALKVTVWNSQASV